MQALKIAMIVLFLSSLCTTMSCEKSSSTEKTRITITDAWFAEAIDNDGDGYYCDARLYFSLSANKADVNVSVELGIRYSSNNPDDPYLTCFQSTTFSIGDNNDGEWYIHLYQINVAVSENYYDFQLKVYLGDPSDDPIAIATPGSYPDLGHFPLEAVSQDPLEAWMTWLDDYQFEGSFSYYPRIPTGSYYTTLAEKFEKPAVADAFTIKSVRVYLSSIYSSLPPLRISVYSNQNNLPNSVLSENTFYPSATGWNEFGFEYDLSANDIFYVGVGTSINYAVSIDSSSATFNGFVLRYSSANPPSYTWMTQQRNFAIEIYASYTLNLDLLPRTIADHEKYCLQRKIASGGHISPE